MRKMNGLHSYLLEEGFWATEEAGSVVGRKRTKEVSRNLSWVGTLSSVSIFLGFFLLEP